MNDVLPNPTILEGAWEFVLGLAFNQQIRAEQAWRAPRELSRRLEVPITEVVYVDASIVQYAIEMSPSLHPFAHRMASAVSGIAGLIMCRYAGDPRNIWRLADAAEIRVRLLDLPQIGSSKANVGIALLGELVPTHRFLATSEYARQAYNTCRRLETFVGAS